MMAAVLGTLVTEVALNRPDLLAEPVRSALASWDQAVPVSEVLVAPIDPQLADTAAFCQAYQVGLDVSANCVVVSGKREGELRYAACVVLATTRADVNGTVRKLIDVRKASFAPMASRKKSCSWACSLVLPMTALALSAIFCINFNAPTTPCHLPPDFLMYSISAGSKPAS